ncbi:Flagellar basal body rod protein FlgB [Burkholderiales bacterium]|nr:Flagellar basal body rod protein FlgB [Burkholderiales bacterium]
MISRLDEAFRFQEMVLNLRVKRQDLLASNIANADTPNYKARDIDFEASLKAALSGRAENTGAVPLARRDLAHQAGLAAAAGDPQVRYTQPAQPSIDGNTVELDSERARFTENALHIEANLVFLSGRIKQLLSAIQGQ